MEIGQAYNPYRQFVGAWIPNWLLRRKEVSDYAKLVFARLCQYAGESGRCVPHQKTIATETGKTERTVQRAIEELVKVGLIQVERQEEGRKGNRYFFIWHKWIEEDHDIRVETKPDETKKEAQKYADDSLPIRIAKYLFKKIQHNDPKAKEPDFQKWAVHVDRLIRIDGRTPKEIAAVIDWCQENEFWRANILSTQSLREKFQRLVLQMTRDKQEPTPQRRTTYRCPKCTKVHSIEEPCR